MAETKTLKIVPPLENLDEREHRRQLALAAQMLMDGRSNNKGDVTLTANTAATIISDFRIGPDSFINLSPLTSNAASMSWYVSSRGSKTATITHDSTANADQDFVYIVVGG